MSSRIIDSDTHLIDLDFHTSEELRENISYYLSRSQINGKVYPRESIIIQGDTFSLLEKGDRQLVKSFIKLSLQAESVVACRFSPKQKQSVVQMVRENTSNYPTLAVGDGANDVNMILQAHVGIGIQGVEGSQASRASDFSIGEFK